MLKYRSNPPLVKKDTPEVKTAVCCTDPAEPHTEEILRIERRRMLARERKRQERARKKLGAVLVKFLVFEDAVDAALSRGEITEQESDDPKLLSAFLEDDTNNRLLKGGLS